MWPLPKIQYEQVCVSITNTNAHIAWISPSSTAPRILKKFISLAWNGSTRTLSEELHHFVKKHSLQHALLNIALSSPLIHEELLRASTACPSAQELGSSQLKKMLWDYRYLHTLDDGHSLFYVCGISRPLLFEQQLLAQQSQVSLLNITSGYMALINAYKLLAGAAFRRSQLALDLIEHDYQLEKSIKHDSVFRLLQINPELNLDIDKHKLSLLTLVGIFNQERMR